MTTMKATRRPVRFAPRTPCPNAHKGCKNFLTPHEARNGYQCDACTRVDEGGCFW